MFDHRVEDVRLRVAGVELSGLSVEPVGEARASILALHGGGMRASYFHGQASPDLSLLSLASRLGYRVLSIDRPGYGASSGLGRPGASIAGQAAICLAALDTFSAGRDTGAGWGVVAHSYGMKVAIAMAANDEKAQLVGIDCSGAGIRFDGAALSHLGGEQDPQARRDFFWGPRELYPPGTFQPGRIDFAEVPAEESEEAPTWPDQLPGYATRVRVPVRYTVAEYERWWDVSPGALEEFRSLFTQTPRVEVDHQPGAGHNISLGYSAEPYHRRALAFIDECCALREQGGTYPGAKR